MMGAGTAPSAVVTRAHELPDRLIDELGGEGNSYPTSTQASHAAELESTRRANRRLLSSVAGLAALLLVAAGAAILAIVAPTAASAAVGPGALAVEVVPAKVTLGDGTAVVRVANSGDAEVTGVALEVDAPAAVTWHLDRTDIGTLPPGASALITLTLDGTAGSAVVTARGQTGGITVSAAAGVQSAMPTHTLALVGNTRLTERSPADLVVVVTNGSDATVNVELFASAGKQRATPPRRSFELGPREVRDVPLTVEGAGNLRRGTVGLIVQARITGAGTQHLVTTRELTVAIAADELPGPLGVSSLLLVPGLVALLVFFEVRSKDRKRIGVAHPGAKVVWDNKTWLLLAGGLSLAVVAVYDAVMDRDVLDAPLVRDITLLTVAVGAAGAVAALVSVRRHRISTPVINTRSDPAQVLRAAYRSDKRLERPRYKVGDKFGLLVHRDGDALVLTPPISFEPRGALYTAWSGEENPHRFEHIIDALPDDFDGQFSPGLADIPEITAIAIEDAERAGHAVLLEMAS
jgi:hypothetical protein